MLREKSLIEDELKCIKKFKMKFQILMNSKVLEISSFMKVD